MTDDKETTASSKPNKIINTLSYGGAGIILAIEGIFEIAQIAIQPAKLVLLDLDEAIEELSPKTYPAVKKGIGGSYGKTRDFIGDKFDKHPNIAFGGAGIMAAAMVGTTGFLLHHTFANAAAGAHSAIELLGHQILYSGVGKGSQIILGKNVVKLWKKADGSLGHRLINPAVQPVARALRKTTAAIKDSRVYKGAVTLKNSVKDAMAANKYQPTEEERALIGDSRLGHHHPLAYLKAKQARSAVGKIVSASLPFSRSNTQTTPATATETPKSSPAPSTAPKPRL